MVRLSHALLLSQPKMGKNRIFRVAKRDLPIVISEALCVQKSTFISSIISLYYPKTSVSMKKGHVLLQYW